MRGDRMFEMIGFQVAKLYLIYRYMHCFLKKADAAAQNSGGIWGVSGSGLLHGYTAFPVFVKYCTALPARTVLSWEKGEEAVCRFSDSGNESAV